VSEDLPRYVLERLAYPPAVEGGPQPATLGRLTILGGPTLYTCERPWAGNAGGESCIPDGEYTAEPHDSDSNPHTWAIVGAGVSHYRDPEAERYAILLPPGNTARESDGCVLPGLRLGALGGDWAVLDSRQAMSALREHLPDRFRLSIIPACGTPYP
jgi:hypothetical protein